ncbi:MAG: ribosomal protein S18-alanine N-acetyltransferase [Deltaproteobacteria bacterium]|nr:ribosomal protein S18-alanine N-acetyltransferase [Deltaproteobacteria bacterium]
MVGRAGALTVLRPLTPEDLDAVAALDAVANPHPWVKRQFEEEVANPRACCLVADHGAGPLAVLVGWHVAGEWHVLEVATHPAARRRGHARALLQEGAARAAAAGCTRSLLEVRSKNAPARTLYRSLGFTEDGRRPRYYAPDGDDAILMSAPLPLPEPARS